MILSFSDNNFLADINRLIGSSAKRLVGFYNDILVCDYTFKR